MYRLDPSKTTLNVNDINKAFYSKFDLSHEVKGVNDMGNLIPIYYEDVIPGDRFNIKANVVIRFNPMVSPLLHAVKMKVYYFFVPYRLVWDEWETFITGGQDGQQTLAVPQWYYDPSQDSGYDKIWDSLGLPLFQNAFNYYDPRMPHDFVRRAYNLIWNEWFRHQDLQNPVPLTNKNLLKKNYDFDYFISALPFQQRGVVPALPVLGQGYLNLRTFVGFGGSAIPLRDLRIQMHNSGSQTLRSVFGVGSSDNHSDFQPFNTLWSSTQDLINQHFRLPPLTTTDIHTLRLSVQLQAWMERNARAGYRYVDFLKAHFPASPRDDRLQRPEYLGGFFDFVQITEVQSMAETTSQPLGSIAGSGAAIMRNNDSISYTAQEHGVILGLLCVYPDHALNSQGVPRYFLKAHRFDFYFPEFALLSDQAIWRAEIFADNLPPNQVKAPFGYVPRYSEYRIRNSYTTGLMRTAFSHWHLHRNFTNPLF